MTYAYALRPAFTPLTLVLMVIGFIVAWPLGLVMLGYILWGHRIPEVRRHFEGMKRDWDTNRSEAAASRGDWAGCGPRGFARSNSGNEAFDDYRAAEMKRLDEERRRLDDERREFEGYVRNLRRARDKEEFDRFRNDRATKQGGETIDL